MDWKTKLNPIENLEKKGVLRILIYMYQKDRSEGAGIRRIEFRRELGLSSECAKKAQSILFEQKLIEIVQRADVFLFKLTEKGTQIAQNIEKVLNLFEK